MTVLHAVKLTPPPPLHHIQAVATAMRGATICHLGHQDGDVVIAGKTAGGKPMGGAHRHTHWLPATLDGKTLHGLIVWTPAGLPDVQAAAVRKVGRLYTGTWEGTVTPIAGLSFGAPATVWTSLTPYVPVKFKQNLEAGLARECGYRGHPTPVEIRCETWPDPKQLWHTSRPGSEGRPKRKVTLRFPHPVAAPLVLGYGSHFGLGVFQPAEG